jgi:hypothetical protein
LRLAFERAICSRAAARDSGEPIEKFSGLTIPNLDPRCEQFPLLRLAKDVSAVRAMDSCRRNRCVLLESSIFARAVVPHFLTSSESTLSMPPSREDDLKVSLLGTRIQSSKGVRILKDRASKDCAIPPLLMRVTVALLLPQDFLEARQWNWEGSKIHSCNGLTQQKCSRRRARSC